jgi:thiol-disulfide isomerase/thioredoxin
MGKNTAKPKGDRQPLRPAQPPSKSANKLLMWGVIGLIVALAAGIAVWSVSGKDDSTSAAPTTVSALPACDASAPTTPCRPAETQPVAVVGTPLPPLEDPSNDPAIGAAAPELQGFSFDGSPIDIKPGTGGPMLLVFFAHWCPHCNRELPVIDDWRKAGKVPAGLQVFGISTGVMANAPNYPPSQWVKTMDWTWPVLADSADGDAAIGYGLQSYPYFVVVGADGKVLVRNSGEMSVDDFDQLVRSALAS